MNASDAATAAGSAPSENEIRNWLIRRVSQAAGVPENDIDIAAPFADYGLDSRQAVGLAGDLETWLKRELDPTLVWDYPSIDRLARYLAGATAASA